MDNQLDKQNGFQIEGYLGTKPERKISFSKDKSNSRNYIKNLKSFETNEILRERDDNNNINYSKIGLSIYSKSLMKNINIQNRNKVYLQDNNQTNNDKTVDLNFNGHLQQNTDKASN